MVDGRRFDVHAAAKQLRQAHALVRDLLGDPPGASSLRPGRQFEDAVFGLFRAESAEFYRFLTEQSGGQSGLIHGLKEDLNILKIQTLDFLDGKKSAGRQLAADLNARLKLEESILIPILSRIADQAPEPQSKT